ncbi:YibE/F family protein [Crossiella sp. SN42]|uniref:YibE/F family protein n=1 Tax=Crossiella sp. SN42 TaxID=2944808 RepID=UPI0027E159BA|nr:YibE/F family protein [Crossiella sp. SN42]
MSASPRPSEPTGHGHGHGHGPAEPVSRRVRTLLTALLAPLALAAVLGGILLYPFGSKQATGGDLGLNRTPVHAEVTAVSQEPCPSGGQGESCQAVMVKLTDGPGAGATVRLAVPLGPSAPKFTINDAVVLAYSGEGNPREGTAYELVDFQRGLPLGVLAAIFALAVLVLARWRGLAALGALALSFLVLMYFMLPAILAGKSPLAVAVVGAGIIMFAALYLTHGFSARTSTAVLGTLASLLLIGFLGAAFVALTHLTGLDEDTTNLITLLGRPVDTQGLLLAGIIIGALGVLDDVTVTQASAVWELRRANPALNWRRLYAAGLRIGRDHAGSAVNTLFMAYAGAALPMLITFSVSGRTFGEIATTQHLATEIVRTLVGSIGLVAAVPVTTLLAALVAVREPIPDPPEADDPKPAPEPKPEADPESEATAEPARPQPARSQPAVAGAHQRPPATGTQPRLSPSTASNPRLRPPAPPGGPARPAPAHPADRRPPHPSERSNPALNPGSGHWPVPSPPLDPALNPGSGQWPVPSPSPAPAFYPGSDRRPAPGPAPNSGQWPVPGPAPDPDPALNPGPDPALNPGSGRWPAPGPDPVLNPGSGRWPVPGPAPALNPSSGQWPAPNPGPNPGPNPDPDPNRAFTTGQWPTPAPPRPIRPTPLPDPAEPPPAEPRPAPDARRPPPPPSQQWGSPQPDQPAPDHPGPTHRPRHRRD